MNIKKNKIYLVFIITLLVQVNFSFAQFRKYSNEFLNIGAGARAMGMGGAQIASSNDGYSGYWNPAGLSSIKTNAIISAQHAEYFGGIGKYDFLSFVKPINNTSKAFGVTVLRFAIDDIPNTLFLVDPNGSVNYNNITTFSSADYAFLLAFSNEKKIGENKLLRYGGNAKIIYRKIGSFANAVGFGLDAGVQYVTKNYGLAAVLRDATSTFNSWSFNFTDREKEVLYLTNNSIPVKSTENTAPKLLIGGYYNFTFKKNMVLKTEASLDLTFDGKRNTVISSNFVSIDPHVGTELGFNDKFYLRAGITNFQKALSDGDTTNMKKVWIFQPSVGIGFKLKDIKLDYAFSNLANQAEPLYTHIISLSLYLKRKEKQN